jgi:hypothetical protein
MQHSMPAGSMHAELQRAPCHTHPEPLSYTSRGPLSATHLTLAGGLVGAAAGTAQRLRHLSHLDLLLHHGSWRPIPPSVHVTHHRLLHSHAAAAATQCCGGHCWRWRCSCWRQVLVLQAGARGSYWVVGVGVASCRAQRCTPTLTLTIRLLHNYCWSPAPTRCLRRSCLWGCRHACCCWWWWWRWRRRCIGRAGVVTIRRHCSSIVPEIGHNQKAASP